MFNKRAVSIISGSEEGSESSGRSKTSPLSSTSSVASGQQRAVRDGHPSLSCTPCPTVEPGKCCTAHTDPATGRLPKIAPRAASLRSTSLPHCGYAYGLLGPACAVSASLVSAPQSVSLAHSDHQARLCDSVRPASRQVQRCPLHFSESCRCPCFACGGRSPTGEGRDRAGPSSRYDVRVLQPLLHCTQEKRWVTTGLGPASFESEPSQATVQNAHAETHFRVQPLTASCSAQLAHSWPRGLRKYAFPPVSLLAQTLCKVREDEEQVLIVAPYWPNRTWFPELTLLMTAPPWRIPLRKDLLSQRRGTLWHLRPDFWKLHVWSPDGTRRFKVTYPLRYLTPSLWHVHRLQDVLTL